MWLLRTIYQLWVRRVHVLLWKLILYVIKNVGDIAFPNRLLTTVSEVLLGAIPQVLCLCTSRDSYGQLQLTNSDCKMYSDFRNSKMWVNMCLWVHTEVCASFNWDTKEAFVLWFPKLELLSEGQEPVLKLSCTPTSQLLTSHHLLMSPVFPSKSLMKAGW